MEVCDLFKEQLVMQVPIAITLWRTCLQKQSIATIFKMKNDIWLYWFDGIFSPFNVFPFPLPSSKLLSWNSAAEHHSVHVTVSRNLSSTLGEHFWPVICAIKSDILEISVPWPANNTQLLFSPCHNSFNSSFKISLVYLLCITKNLIILYT